MTTSGADNTPIGSAVVLVTAESQFHADALVAVLADHDIEAFAAPDIQHGAGLDPTRADRSVRVLVHQSDLGRARAALRQNVEDAQAMNWDELDGGHDDASGESVSRRGRPPMPMLPRLGFIAAAILIAVMIIGTLLMFLF